MIRITLEDRLEPPLDDEGAGNRLPGGRPQPPGVHGHLGFCSHDLDVVIVRKARRDAFHRLRVGSEQRIPGARARRLRTRVTRRQRLDQRPLNRRGAGGVRARLPQRLKGEPHAHLIHAGQVVVRPHGQRDAPVAGRAVRVECGGLCERAGRLIVVERPQEAHALIEVRLRLR